MSSRGNVRKRGSTWTYYVYVVGGDGRRRQVSKGGFRTRKEAEAARIKALGSLQSGTWVRPERVTGVPQNVGRFGLSPTRLCWSQGCGGVREPSTRRHTTVGGMLDWRWVSA